MRPIKLKIKGLNSFIEEQEIDFDKLTSRGLFGIFGPTGSGKSTILDGITLALYGEVARKSSNYINTNLDSAKVSFEFQISGAEKKRYLVEREFRIDKKSGNPRSGKCKIVDITLGESNVIADTVGGVTSACKEIIGLNLEDFTRTVVLPQGKFSEFLKLEGKNRREMLERLFNLQEYGDELSKKLTIEIGKEKTASSVLLGELKGYEDINEEVLKERKGLLKELEINIKELSLDLENVKNKYLEMQEVWNLQKELKEYRAKEEVMKSKEKDINCKKEKILVAQGAARVKPYIDSYRNTISNMALVEKRLLVLKKDLDEAIKSKNTIYENWNKVKERKDKELPNLKGKESTYLSALEEKRAIDNLSNEIEELTRKIKSLNRKLQGDERLYNECKKNRDIIERDISNKEKKIENLKVDAQLKEKVQRGVVLEEKLVELEDLVKSLEKKKTELDKIINEGLLKNKELEIELNNIKDNYEKEKKILDEMLINPPGKQEDLSELKSSILDYKDKFEKSNSLKEDKEKYIREVRNAEEFIKDRQQKKTLLEKTIEEIKNRIKEAEVENLAHKIRETLSEGEVCPVCGSKEHFFENLKNVNVDYNNLDIELNKYEEEEKLLDKEVNKFKTNMDIYNTKLEEVNKLLENLGHEYNKETLDEMTSNYNSLEKSLKEYFVNKEKSEILVSDLREKTYEASKKLDTNKITNNSNEKRFDEIKEEYEKSNKDLEDLRLEYKKLVEETAVDNFKDKSIEIRKIEEEREGMLVDIRNKRSTLESIINRENKLQEQMQRSREELVSINTEIKEKQNNRESRVISLRSKVENYNNINEVLTNIQKNIEEIEKNYIKLEKDKDEADRLYEKSNESYIEEVTKSNELYKRKEKEREALDKALREEGFSSEEVALQGALDKNVLELISKEIQDYNEEVSKNLGAIETVIGKINNRVVKEEDWTNIQKLKEDKELELKNLNDVKVRKEEEVRVMASKIEELKGLLKKKEVLDHKLALLGDLEKLFKGKRFVEFVAQTRLKYVSREASKRLKEISSGNYGLEVDENGKFIIRDYKNGGVARDASTLSGGETFIASLALALALSAEIQLKGTVPLELFFLDEGFGTLDDELLEVVMESLEKIHNDKLKIGIISHVESIKNRVPVKLILTPAESGRGGSKVKIELT